VCVSLGGKCNVAVVGATELVRVDTRRRSKHVVFDWYVGVWMDMDSVRRVSEKLFFVDKGVTFRSVGTD